VGTRAWHRAKLAADGTKKDELLAIELERKWVLFDFAR
jgi:hypothetical protein